MRGFAGVVFLACAMGGLHAGGTRVGSAAVRPGSTGQEAAAAVKSLHLQGQKLLRSPVSGLLSRPTAVEFKVLPPDACVRIDTDGTTRRVAGFQGATLLNRWVSLQGGGAFAPAPFPPEQIVTERESCVRLVLAIFGETKGTMAVSLSPRGTNVVHATGPRGFAATIDVDPVTRLPKSLTYRGRMRLPQPGGLVRTEGGGARATMPDPQEADISVNLSDRRPVHGVLVPHRIVTSAKGMVIEDISFEAVRINTLTASDIAR